VHLSLRRNWLERRVAVKRVLYWLGLALIAVQILAADTLRLKDGTEIQGKLVGSDESQVQFRSTAGFVMSIPADGIAGIDVGDASGAAPPASSPTARPVARAAASPQPVGSSVVIPAGTQIVVRLRDPIDSRNTAVGEPFRASVDDPIVAGNRVVVQRGEDALIQIVQAQGNRKLFIKLHSVSVGGRSYDVASSYAQVKSKGKGGETARRAAGLGALGALMGGIAGGGRGALIGLGAGAGVGALSVAASGDRIQLPPETRLGFTLRAPLPLG
jgi:hypothetical protein